ncbi:MAG TPA: sigma-70 family RNA polymerase sigma factor [Candidatus Eisenbacteria bacterium]|nr:sigma-70 family RNA polymerase sigma factor [Candidatus Eisenbacteria bacterium]
MFLEQKFEEMCRPQLRRIHQTAYRITRNREDAEDAVQESLLQAFLHLRDFDGRSAFSTWLTRIVINSSLMLLRKRRNHRSVSLDFSSDPDGNPGLLEPVDGAAQPEQQYLGRERERTLREAVGLLRPAIRRVLEVQLEECSMKKTAEMMGISVCAAKGRLFHGKAALRKSRKLKVLVKEGHAGATLHSHRGTMCHKLHISSRITGAEGEALST